MGTFKTNDLSISDKTFVIVSHHLFNGVNDDIKKYLLKNNCKALYSITHEFSSLKTRRSFFEYYKDGKLIKEYASYDYSFLPDPLVNAKDILFTVYNILTKLNDPIDVYFGCGSINAFAGCLLKKIGKLRRVIYYTIDYAPQRFNNPLLNTLHHWFDRYSLKNSYETWNVSPRMAIAREKLNGLQRNIYKRQKTVPIGIWFKEIKRLPFNKINKTELIFVGHILEKQGIQEVINAIPAIVKKIPRFTFRIIGEGVYLKNLKKLSKELNIEKHVIFEGPIYDQKKVNAKLVKAALGVAMYDKNLDDYTYYADSTKIKTYLGTGLPILLTDLPYNAREIEKRQCGKIVTYNKGAIASATIELMQNKKTLQEYKRNVEIYAKEFDWDTILSQNLLRILNKNG